MKCTRVACSVAALLVAAGVLCLAGCGGLADKDRIRIARMDDEYITRGDLNELISEMPDKERPNIRNKGDLRRVLNDYIDRKLKIPLGQRLAEEGKIEVPRERAREQFFRQSGDDEEQLRSIWNMKAPESGQMTPLMEVYNLTPERIEAMKTIIEQETDRIQQEMLGNEAVAYLAVQALREGKMELPGDVLEEEYRLRSEEFKKLEWMRFVGIRFPAAEEGALEKAAALRERLDAGADFETIVQEYVDKAPGRVIQSEIENNPELTRFRGFWSTAAGAEKGDLIGPVYLPEYQQMVQDQQGRTAAMNQPAAYVVLKVLEHTPERQLTLEEAKPLLAPPLLVAEQMKRLRKQHNVEIYEDKLPDPAQFRSQFSDPFADY